MSYIDDALSVLSKIRFDNIKIKLKRFEEVKWQIPQIAEIDKNRADLTAKLACILSSSADNKSAMLDELNKENADAQTAIEKLLVDNGYPHDYLEDIYSCDKCRDTGYVNLEMCSCLKQILYRVKSAKLSESLPMGNICFDNFNLDYYSNTPKPELKGLSPRAIMQKNYDYCKQYTEDFGASSDSIFMSGGTGLGKTHLSLSIAKAVIEKGYAAVYGSVPDLLRRVENAHFGKSNDVDVLDTLKTVDLLVLDDLGAEFTSPFYISVLYDIINTRLCYRKPLIASTNLTFSELTKRYEDRIASRLLSMNHLTFKGSDIRILSKYSRNG